MSSHLPLYAVDKMEVKFALKVASVVKVDKVAKFLGVSRNAVVQMFVDAKLDEEGVMLTKADIKRVEEIMDANREKRRILRERKGVKE